VLPCLPSDDPSPEPRSAALARRREVYRYSYAWPPEVAVAAEVPKLDGYSPAYVVQSLAILSDSLRNLLPVAELFVSPDKVHEFLADELEKIKALGPGDLKGHLFDMQANVARHMTSASPKALADYGRFYNCVAAPPGWTCWDDDRSFAWQRVAGVNPMAIRRVDAIPEHVAIGEREMESAVPGHGSLAAALAEGRVFACDYGLFAGALCGVTDGRRKWLPAPYAVFVSVGGALRPVAIQAGPTPESPVFTPRDGHGWRVARLAMQTADASHHEFLSHLGHTHLVIEAVALATYRQLAPNHPLCVLLTPHLDQTLPINHSAATSLIAPGGSVDLMFGPRIEAAVGFVKKGLDAFVLPRSSISADLAERGLDDPRTIADHPYRDDGLLVWGAIRRFVEAYVRRYYSADTDVTADEELAAWTREMGSPEGGRLSGIRPLETVGALAELMAIIVWTASAQHSAVNFGQFPNMGAVTNMPGAFWAEWPVPGVATDEATLLSVLPPYNMAMLQQATVYQLSQQRNNRLGHYPLLHFKDREVRGLVDQFNADLQAVEKVIAARDRDRFLPYPYLFPSSIPASIHI
jgi:arachidonate 15-lipoxygenase